MVGLCYSILHITPLQKRFPNLSVERPSSDTQQQVPQQLHVRGPNINTPQHLEGGTPYITLHNHRSCCYGNTPRHGVPTTLLHDGVYFCYSSRIPVTSGAMSDEFILVTPELDVPPPFDWTADQISDIHERAKLAFNTVEFLRANGLDDVEITEADRKDARAVFMDSPAVPPESINTPAKALILSALLNEYDFDVVRNAQQLRNYIKLKYLELSNSGNAKIELKALEMLGKLSDVGAFTERIDINVTHRTTEELEADLAKKLSSYLSDIIDVDAKEAPTLDYDPLPTAPAVQVINVDDELGLVGGELDDNQEESDEAEF